MSEQQPEGFTSMTVQCGPHPFEPDAEGKCQGCGGIGEASDARAASERIARLEQENAEFRRVIISSKSPVGAYLRRAEAAEAELAALQAERDNLRQLADARAFAAEEARQRHADELATARAERARLQPYLQHHKTCNKAQFWAGRIVPELIDTNTCTCGLELAALDPTGEG